MKSKTISRNDMTKANHACRRGTGQCRASSGFAPRLRSAAASCMLSVSPPPLYRGRRLRDNRSAMTDGRPKTLLDKIWDAHVVQRFEDGTCVLYIDRHLLDEVHSPQAFAGLRSAGRSVRRPEATI